MSKAPQTVRTFIDGHVGRLESIIATPVRREINGGAVICHPHPQHGGTMHNKVTHTLARAFVARGLVTLRFNFRGVGASEGQYDDGIGETDDVLAALAWMRGHAPHGPVWLAGFSFGAAIALQAAVAEEVSGLVSVAPGVSQFGNVLHGQPRCPWLVVQGDKDEYVALDGTINWLNTLDAGPELLVVPDAAHFFHGKLTMLREAVQSFVEGNTHTQDRGGDSRA